MKRVQHEACGDNEEQKLSKKGFHFRLAPEPEAFELTGMVNNAITPFFMKPGGQKLPILLSEKIAKLDPSYFWMGGGRLELKMGISVEEFV